MTPPKVTVEKIVAKFEREFPANDFAIDRRADGSWSFDEDCRDKVRKFFRTSLNTLLENIAREVEGEKDGGGKCTVGEDEATHAYWNGHSVGYLYAIETAAQKIRAAKSKEV